MRILGLDLSLASTGVAALRLDADGAVTSSGTEVVKSSTPEHDTLHNRIGRVERIAWQVLDLVMPESQDPPDVDLVVVEGPSYESSGGKAQERAWLRGLVYCDLHLARVRIVEVSPSTLKLYATGNGRAGKPLVVQSIRRHYGDRFDIPLRKADGREDVADAITCVAMAARSIGHPIDLDHPTRTRAMRSPRWAH